MTTPDRIPLSGALSALRSVRTDEVVVSVMGAAREWVAGDLHPLDWVYVPSSMGQATSIGLGIALAQPDRKVIVFNGDGSLLMNLGSLVTLTAAGPRNLTVVLCDNRMYEVTGAQATPAAAAIRADGRDLDYAQIARACGFTSVHTFDNLDRWQACVRDVIDESGPTFVLLHVAGSPDAGSPRPPAPGPDRVSAFRAALSGRN